MPCWNLLGVEICIPSLDDIVNAVVAPITSFITDSLNSLVNTLSPLFSDITNTLSPLFQTVIDAIINFVKDPLNAIQAALGNISSVVSGLWGQISNALEGLSTSIINAINSIGPAVQGAIASASESFNGALSSMGASISGALETAQGAILTAFDGMGNAISGVIGGVFSGFGSADTDAILGAHANVGGLLETAIKALGLTHSPISPEEAERWAPNFINQVMGAVTTLHITNTVTEAVSLGQIDISLSEAWKYPYTAAALDVASEFAAMPLREGMGPALKRAILKSYQPNIPPYQDLIGIYVKEGYLEDHWVEIPPEMIENFKELGYSEYWTKRLWGKHWQYPSPTQLYEMLHRTAGTRPDIGVTPEVLRDMLKLHDYEPKWRYPLEAISWRTWRIYDIRTSWEMGLEDEDTILKRLIDTGFEPTDARILLEVQKMFVLRSEIDAIVREAETDFIEGWISEDQLRADLEATPYNPDVIELRILRAKLRRERELKRDIKAALTDRFVKGDLTEEEYEKELSRLGITQDWISAELERARARKLKRVKAA